MENEDFDIFAWAEEQEKKQENEVIEEDLNTIDENQKMEITPTEIICDGSGFHDMTKKNRTKAPPDFSEYRLNNFRIPDNEYLDKLKRIGGALVLHNDGELMLRSSPDADFIKVTPAKASIVISKLIGEHVVVGRGTKDKPPDIKYEELMLVSEIVFKPHIMSEFYKDGNTYKMNKFNPSEHMMLNKNTPYKKPVYTLKLIAHLVNYDTERFHYIINWLAYMFVYLTKSIVAVVLRGVPGSGKGLLFNKIIASLFGEDFVFTIGNKNLKSQFLGSLFEFRLFVNLNEMSHDLKSNKELKNFIKELVTEAKLSAEKKYENLSKAIDLCAQILITSNETYVLEVEPEDRRFTIFSTAGNIFGKDCNFFGLGDFPVFQNKLESEIKDFALYLKNYQIDPNLANKALQTPEKKALVKGTNDRFKLFINILVNKDIASLEPLNSINQTVYANIITGFKKDRIYQKDILPAFTALNPSDYNISAHALLDKLQVYEPTKFSRELRKKSGDWYFNL